ncbi:hypothetical protein [Planococcus lenghuensis]|uniref:Uncharacterized protein n=1 Tax=Planococcus lenghuensis TaxID=2213202 RepID=A0A1Q2KYX9_9BACL|nr:hypothetical protein [Planococcus lenghuensis]AQQ53336.1 hypothetical protein B0X71_09760 [Planococcus lenghuensis]
MTKTELAIAVSLIIAGLLCLTMSGGLLFDPGSASFFGTFVQVCLWMGLPLLTVGIVYWRVGWKKKR